MSLINDALKRAKAVQDQSPVPAGPALRPVEPAQRTVREIGLLLPCILAAVALAGLLFTWQVQKRTVRAKAPVPAPAQAPAPDVVALEAALPPAPMPAEPEPELAAVELPAPVQTEPEPPTNDVAQVPAPDETLLPVQMQVVSAAPLKLQAVVFHPQRPSVMINGRTMRVGDRLGDFRLINIQPSSATIVGRGRTNVLELPE